MEACTLGLTIHPLVSSGWAGQKCRLSSTFTRNSLRKYPGTSLVSKSRHSPSPPHAVSSSQLQTVSQGSSRTAFSSHTLPSSLKLEVITELAGVRDGAVSRTPLLFIHGSYHAAWCWAEYWMPYLAGRGYDCYALSLLGQGGSDKPDAKVAGTIQSHAADVAHFIRHTLPAPPVLIGHSFGGLVVQAYLAQLGDTFPGGPEGLHPRLAGAALLASVPPSGNSGIVKRYFQNDIVFAIRLTWSFITNASARSTPLCRDVLFSASMPDSDVDRLREKLAATPSMRLLDLNELNASLPLARPSSYSPPLLVAGAKNDRVVDNEAVEETALYHGTEPVMLPNLAHDLMLDVEWQAGADALLDWLASIETA